MSSGRSRCPKEHRARRTASKATGPFCGHRDDQFAVLFEMDVTHKESRQRHQMAEVALYTVRAGKVVQEEFLYLQG